MFNVKQGYSIKKALYLLKYSQKLFPTVFGGPIEFLCKTHLSRKPCIFRKT